MDHESVILVNVLKAKPGRQASLIALLQRNTQEVIRTLPGWKATRLIAATDAVSVIIYSEWESAAGVEGMRSDPRMQAYFPQILELASLESFMGGAVHQAQSGTG